MRNLLLVFLLPLFVFPLHAQDVITGGNMENEDAWIAYWRTDSPDAGFHNFGFTNDRPTGGEGGCLEVYGFGQSGIFVFQEVTIEPGANYTFDALIKNISADPLTSTWVELILSSKRPDDEGKADWGASNGDYIYSANSWMDAPYNTMDTDGLFSETYSFSWRGGNEGENVDLTGTNLISIPDTITNTTWYVCFKAGCWNDAGAEEPAFNFLIDNISLTANTETGINNLTINNLSNIYPNPSNGIINLSTSNGQKAFYQFIDLSGKMVLKGNFNGTTTLNANNLNKGMYFVKIATAAKLETHKLIIE